MSVKDIVSWSTVFSRNNTAQLKLRFLGFMFPQVVQKH